MKTPEELFHGLLGLGEMWRIKEIQFDQEKGEVRIEVEGTERVAEGQRCPKDNGESALYDNICDREWRHLDIGQRQLLWRIDDNYTSAWRRGLIWGRVEVDLLWSSLPLPPPMGGAAAPKCLSRLLSVSCSSRVVSGNCHRRVPG